MPAHPPRRAAVPSAEDRYPAWRPRTHSPESLRELAAAQEKELELLALIRRLSALENTPLEELYLHSSLLGGASDSEALKAEALAYAQRMRERAPLAANDFDAEGNPLWISLTLRERRDDGTIQARGVLPSDEESAAPRSFLQDSLEKSRERSGLFGALIALLGRLTGLKKEEPQKERAVRPKSAGQKTSDPKTSDLSGFIKMLLLGAVMALVWHYFGRG